MRASSTPTTQQINLEDGWCLTSSLTTVEGAQIALCTDLPGAGSIPSGRYTRAEVDGWRRAGLGLAWYRESGLSRLAAAQVIPAVGLQRSRHHPLRPAPLGCPPIPRPVAEDRSGHGQALSLTGLVTNRVPGGTVDAGAIRISGLPPCLGERISTYQAGCSGILGTQSEVLRRFPLRGSSLTGMSRAKL